MMKLPFLPMWCAVALFLGNATDLPAGPKTSAADRNVVELHAGIRGVVYLGQPLEDLLKKNPGARTKRDNTRPNTAQITLPDAGIICLAVGTTADSLELASIRFDMDRVYDAVVPDGYRTAKGIGPGSSVNDVVVAYGKPTEIYKPQVNAVPAITPAQDDPVPYEKYQYASDDGTFSSYFIIQGSAVQAVVVNDKAPLNRHIRERPAG